MTRGPSCKRVRAAHRDWAGRQGRSSPDTSSLSYCPWGKHRCPEAPCTRQPCRRSTAGCRPRRSRTSACRTIVPPRRRRHPRAALRRPEVARLPSLASIRSQGSPPRCSRRGLRCSPGNRSRPTGTPRIPALPRTTVRSLGPQRRRLAVNLRGRPRMPRIRVPASEPQRARVAARPYRTAILVQMACRSASRRSAAATSQNEKPTAFTASRLLPV